ncbi:MAG: hypothetical protein LBI20_00510 [Holosporales bacterium]|jgi:predicted RNase H-like nuclease (RuvC/YqgF family)|nr:hypothetical protein [Holosporales bacterium]
MPALASEADQSNVLGDSQEVIRNLQAQIADLEKDKTEQADWIGQMRRKLSSMYDYQLNQRETAHKQARDAQELLKERAHLIRELQSKDEEKERLRQELLHKSWETANLRRDS